MFGPLFDDENFTPEDFHLMESMLHSSATEEIQEALRKMPLEPPESMKTLFLWFRCCKLL